MSVRSGAGAGRFAIPLVALVGLAVAGDATLALLFWLLLIFASHGAVRGDRSASALIGAYLGGFAFVAATLLGAAGASTPPLSGRLEAGQDFALLLAVLAAASALPLLAVDDESGDTLRPTLLALASVVLLARSAIAWGTDASMDARLGAAALSLVGGLLAGRLAGPSATADAAVRRQLAAEVGLIGAAWAVGGPVGIAAATALLLNLGLAAMAVVGARGRVAGGSALGLGALAGLPPLSGFLGRALLLGLCLERGYWGLAAGIAVASVASVAALATHAATVRGSGADPDTDDKGGSLLLSIPLVVCGIVPAVTTTASLAVYEIAALKDSVPDAVVLPAIGLLFLATIAGTLLSGEEARQRERRIRRDRLRSAAQARDRARGLGAGWGGDPSRRDGASLVSSIGQRLAEAGAIAIAFQIAIALLGLVVVAFQTGRI